MASTTYRFQTLSEDDIEYISTLVRGTKSRNVQRDFLLSIELAIIRAKDQINFQDINRPREIEQQIYNLLNSSQNSLKSLITLSGGAYTYLASSNIELIEKKNADLFERIKRDLRIVIATSQAALNSELQLPHQSGRPRDVSKIIGAAYIAEAMRIFLDQPPRTSPGSLFEELVLLMVEKLDAAARSREVEPHVGHILRRALKISDKTIRQHILQFIDNVNLTSQSNSD